MNPIARWWAGLREERQMVEAHPYALLSGMPSAAGPIVTEESSLRAGAVFACVRIISESVASLPLVIFEQRGRNRERARTHPLFPVLHDMANREMTSFEWREIAFAHACLWGNHWSEKELDSRGRVVGLWPLRPDKMESYERRNGELWWLYRLPDNTARWIPAYRLHHIRTLGDGVFGYSPIRTAARQAVGLALATEEFGARFFSNGARPGVLIKHPGKLSPAAFERLRASFADMHQGLTNAHRTRILEEGMDIATVGIPPNEAQFLETRKFQVTEIARIFRVPPHMLADLDRATFSNIEHQSLEFVMHTLRPWLVRHEQAIYRDLFTPAERGRLFPKYVVEGLLRGDTATRYAAYTTGIQTGFLTRNEARELEDLNPIDGLDEPLLPLNMMEANAPAPVAEPPDEGDEPRHDHDHAELRAEVSDPMGWSVREERVRRDRQAMMTRSVRLWQDAAERMVKRETADIRRAVNRHLGQRSAESFETWLARFYEEMRGWLPDYFRPLLLTYAEDIMAAIATELDGDPAPLDDDLRAWIEAYLTNFAASYTVGGEKQLRSVVRDAVDEDGDPAAAVLDRMDGWQDTKPGKTGLEQAFEAGNALAIYGYAAAGVAFLRWSARGESCPLCRKLDGRRIPVSGAFLDAGDSVEADGVDPLPVVRKIKHGPLHSGCDCVVVRG